jgi:hypothetical protein
LTARDSGIETGRAEARLFISSPAATIEPYFTAYEWLDRVIAAGRVELQGRNVPCEEIESWDNACRIAFLLATVSKRNQELL